MAIKFTKQLSYEKKKYVAGFLYVLPWAIGLIYFFLIPLVTSLVYSFNKLQIMPGRLEMSFEGLEYYKQLFANETLAKKLVDSMLNLLYQLPMILIFALFIACILNQKFHGRVFLRAVFFFPITISAGVVLGILNGDVVARAMMSGTTESALFTSFSIRDVLLDAGVNYYIADAYFKILNNIFNLAWKSGFQILLFLAALQKIPSSLYEVSKIEGATAWETFWKITFPMISPLIMLNLVYTVVDSFTDSTNPVIMEINRLSLATSYSMASAVSWVYFVFILALMGLLYFFVNRKVIYLND